MITKIISETKKPLSQLASIITKSPQVIVNLEVTKTQKVSFATSTVANAIISQFTEKVKPINGRLLVRPSGTENLIRITVWGDNKDKITALANDLKSSLSERL